MPPKGAKQRAQQRRPSGTSSDGVRYNNVDEMWKVELAAKTADQQLQWYTKALDYWRTSEASVNGVLGGHELVSPADLKETHIFLGDVRREIAPFGQGRCVGIRLPFLCSSF
eukprot:EG_transcript_56577